MTCRVVAAVLGFLLTSAAHAKPPTCSVQAAQRKLTGAALKSFVATCEKKARTARSRRVHKTQRYPRRRGISPTEEERLDRAMSRNILQSIEEELRWQRIGK